MHTKVLHHLINSKYYIVDLTAAGKLRDNDVDVLQLLYNELQNGDYTDVVIVSHGWNTDRTEHGSIELADGVVEQMHRRKSEGVNPLYVAIKWPSAPMALFEGAALETAGGFLKLVKQIRQLIKGESKSVLDRIGDFVATRDFVVDPVDVAAQKVEEVGEKFRKGEMEEEKLPTELAENIAILANALVEQSEDKTDQEAITTNVVESRYQKYRAKQETSSNASDALNAVATLGVFQTAKTVKRVYDLTNTMFDIFFHTFEKRAQVVGKKGVHKLLKDLMNVAKDNVRFHMYGHSLGAHVVFSGAVGEKTRLPRKIHTVMLAQGCVPKNVLAKNGLYREVAEGLKPIVGPILATVFWWDRPLIGYDVWMPSPLGRDGFVDVAPLVLNKNVTIEAKEEGESIQKVGFEAGTCYNLAAGQVVGSHTDVKDKEIMDMFWQAVAVQA